MNGKATVVTRLNTPHPGKIWLRTAKNPLSAMDSINNQSIEMEQHKSKVRMKQFSDGMKKTW